MYKLRRSETGTLSGVDMQTLLVCGEARIIQTQWINTDTNVYATPQQAPDFCAPILYPAQEFSKSREAILKRVDIQVYDMRDKTDQTNALNATLTRSLDTANAAFVQSRFKGAAMFDFQPNYLRPAFRVNGETVITEWGESGVAGFGLPIPYTTEPYKLFDQISSVEVRAKCLQSVNGQFVSYPVLVYAEWFVML